MSKRLFVAMHDSFARRYAGCRSLLNTGDLLGGIGSAKLIGAPGYSMEIAVDDHDEAALRVRLAPNFIIEAMWPASSAGGLPAGPGIHREHRYSALLRSGRRVGTRKRAVSAF
jgi:hypothetical protein